MIVAVSIIIFALAGLAGWRAAGAYLERDRAGMKGHKDCSFCRRREDSVKRLILGPDNVAICDDCVALMHDINADLRTSRHTDAPTDAPIPETGDAA